MNFIRCTRATLPALLYLSIAACGSSSSSSQDAGGPAATGGRATNTGAGGTATGNGGSAGLASNGSGVAGAGSGGTVDAGFGGSVVTGTGGTPGDAGSAVTGSGGSFVTGTGGTPGDAGSVAAAGAGGGAGTVAGAPGPVAGTTSIFDGKTLMGWEQDTKTNLWSVVDGGIDGKGTTGGQLLMTQADYGDFRIVVSSDLVAKGKTGHLGICFWGGRTPVGEYNGCKDIITPGASTDPTVNTWDYGLKPQAGLKGVTKLGTPKINSTWNTTEILCFLAKGFCRVAINGMAVLTYQEPNLKSIQRGPIGLQLHQGTNEEVQYKDVYVDPAPTVDQLLTVN
jgi:Domain of Unknown Function (DUF1080)